MEKLEELLRLAKEKVSLLKSMQVMLALGTSPQELSQMQSMVNEINKQIGKIKIEMKLE